MPPKIKLPSTRKSVPVGIPLPSATAPALVAPPAPSAPALPTTGAHLPTRNPFVASYGGALIIEVELKDGVTKITGAELARGIIVADIDKGAVTLRMFGDVVFTYDGKGNWIQTQNGITVTRDGNTYVIRVPEPADDQYQRGAPDDYTTPGGVEIPDPAPSEDPNAAPRGPTDDPIVALARGAPRVDFGRRGPGGVVPGVVDSGDAAPTIVRDDHPRRLGTVISDPLADRFRAAVARVVVGLPRTGNLTDGGLGGPEGNPIDPTAVLGGPRDAAPPTPRGPRPGDPRRP